MRLLIGVIVVIAVLLFTGVVAQVSAASVQLKQIIEPIPCTITEVSNGSSTTIDTDCPIDLGKIEQPLESGNYVIRFEKLESASVEQQTIIDVDPSFIKEPVAPNIDTGVRLQPSRPGNGGDINPLQVAVVLIAVVIGFAIVLRPPRQS